MKSPILRAKLHAPLATGDKWSKRELELTRLGGDIPLLHGEDAFPVCEVIKFNDDCRLLLLAVADGVGGAHIDRYYRVNHPEGGQYLVTDMRLGAELALSGLKAQMETLESPFFAQEETDQGAILKQKIQSAWHLGAQDLSRARSHTGYRSYVRKGTREPILACTTFTAFCYVESPTGRSIHLFKVGDSPFFIQVGGKLTLSKDIFNGSSRLDGTLSFLRSPNGSVFSATTNNVLHSSSASVEKNEGPITLAAFSDAHGFESLRAYQSTWGPFLRSHHHSEAAVQAALNRKLTRGWRGGANGDDLSMALAHIDPGKKPPLLQEWNVLDWV